MIISMAWTTPAFLAGEKRCTRRDWPPEYARKWRVDTEHDAWSKLPRTRQGRRIGRIWLTFDAYPERTDFMPDADYYDEGFAFFDEHPELLPQDKRSPLCGHKTMLDAFNAWRESKQVLYVVRFRVVEVTGAEERA